MTSIFRADEGSSRTLIRIFYQRHVNNIAHQNVLAIGKKGGEMLRVLRPKPQPDATSGEHRSFTLSWGDDPNRATAASRARGAYQYLVVQHFRHDKLDQSVNRLVDVGRIECVGDPGPDQLSIRRTVDKIEIGFNAHLLFFLQVAWCVDHRIQ